MTVLRKTWPRALRSPVDVPSATLQIKHSGDEKHKSLNKQSKASPTTRQQDVLEWTFIVTSFVLELPSVVLDQLSSVHKPQYALYSMLLSFAAMLIGIVEFVCKGRKEKVALRWRSKLPWFYYPTRRQIPFGTFRDIIGLVCALCQYVVTTINYVCVDKPIKVSIWPIIFAIGLLCSKILENPGKRTVSFR